MLAVASCAGGLLALAIALRLPETSGEVYIAIALGGPAVAYLALSRRYGLMLAILALYIGLLDGFLKLRTGDPALPLFRWALVLAIAGAALIPLLGRWPLPRMPPLTPWVVAFCAVVIVQIFNPNTLNALKATAGLRQHLEFVPLFFVGFMLLRTERSLRNLALLLVVIAAINGLVSLIQYQLTPEELSSWGPGYAERIEGQGVSGRGFLDDSGVHRVRPFALGSDMGFGGAVAVIAAPLTLALLATGSFAKRAWLGGLLGAGVIAAILTSQSRTAIVGVVVAVAAFVALSIAAGRSRRSLAAVLAAVVLAVVTIQFITARADHGSFDRYDSIAPGKVLGTAYNYRVDDNSSLFHYISHLPLGAGLAMTGPAAGFGGGERPVETRDEVLNGETQFNYLAIELGVPGLITFTGFLLLLLWLALTRLRRVQDTRARTYLAGAFSSCFVILTGGLGGPIMSAPPFEPWFWLAAGLAAYWLCREVKRSDGVQEQLGVRRSSFQAAPTHEAGHR